MIPIVLISKDNQKTEKFLQEFITSHNFPSSYIFRFYPEPNVIKIDQIREIQSVLIRSDRERKLIIIFHFETAKEEAQNAFLKTLEEKGGQAQFILSVEEETQVLPTIVSRCQVRLLKGSKRIKEISFSLHQPLEKLLQHYSGLTKEKAVEICDQLIKHFKKKIAEDKATEILKEILRVRNLILRNNLNSQIGIDHLLIFINKTCNMKYVT